MPNTVYQIVTERIIEQLEKGCVPWEKPWATEAPKNLTSKKAYRGVNILLLSGNPYASPWWLTYRQAQQLGGNVRKGEKSTLVVFWKWLEKKRTQEQEQEGKQAGHIPLLRYYRVFNSEQCDGITVPARNKPPVNPIEECERLAASMPSPPKLEHGGDRAFYCPPLDKVQMPVRDSFTDAQAYYSTIFHELTHSTGSKARLDRGLSDSLRPFGSPDYSKEELVAEIGAAMLCGIAGIENAATVKRSASYLHSWLDRLRGDSKLVVHASAQAQKAADYIQGIVHEQTEPLQAA